MRLHAIISSVLNILNSPHHQLTGDLNGERISPVKLSEFVNVIQNVLPTEKTHFKRSNWSIQFSLPPILMIGGVID